MDNIEWLMSKHIYLADLVTARSSDGYKVYIIYGNTILECVTMDDPKRWSNADVLIDWLKQEHIDDE